jgi:hypothetical protein
MRIELTAPLTGLAMIHLDRNEPKLALALLERALAIAESHPGDLAKFAYISFVHGRAVLAATGDRARTCESMRRALESYRLSSKAQDNVAEKADEIYGWLAKHKLPCSP